MRFLLLAASVLAISACVLEPTTSAPDPAAGGDPTLQDGGVCVDANGDFAACE